MTPEPEERLERIREVLHNGLRYYGTAFLNTPADERHVIAERDLLRSHMSHYATVMALVDGDALDDRSMMATRHEVVARYLRAVREDPWTPPPPRD
jgi:hypothetical protein